MLLARIPAILANSRINLICWLLNLGSLKVKENNNAELLLFCLLKLFEVFFNFV